MNKFILINKLKTDEMDHFLKYTKTHNTFK